MSEVEMIIDLRAVIFRSTCTTMKLNLVKWICVGSKRSAKLV